MSDDVSALLRVLADWEARLRAEEAVSAVDASLVNARKRLEDARRARNDAGFASERLDDGLGAEVDLPVQVRHEIDQLRDRFGDEAVLREVEQRFSPDIARRVRELVEAERLAPPRPMLRRLEGEIQRLDEERLRAVARLERWPGRGRFEVELDRLVLRLPEHELGRLPLSAREALRRIMLERERIRGIVLG